MYTRYMMHKVFFMKIRPKIGNDIQAIKNTIFAELGKCLCLEEAYFSLNSRTASEYMWKQMLCFCVTDIILGGLTIWRLCYCAGVNVRAPLSQNGEASQAGLQNYWISSWCNRWTRICYLLRHPSGYVSIWPWTSICYWKWWRTNIWPKPFSDASSILRCGGKKIFLRGVGQSWCQQDYRVTVDWRGAYKKRFWLCKL